MEKSPTMPSNTLKGPFSSAEDEILTKLVRENPALYDQNLEIWKDSHLRHNIWNEIGKTLNRTSEDCKRRWKYIKDAYNRYKRKQKRVGIRSMHLNKNTKFEFYEKLQFLESCSQNLRITNKTSVSDEIQNIHMEGNGEDYIPINLVDEEEIGSDNTNADKLSTQSEAEEYQSKLQNIFKTEQRKKRKEVLQRDILDYVKERDKQREVFLKNICEEKVEKKTDEINLFGEHLIAVLNKLPPILKIQAKAEIFNVINKYELLAFEKEYSKHETALGHPTTLNSEHGNSCY